MTNCQKFQMAAMALAEGETPPIARARIEEHVASCVVCHREIEQLGALGRMLDGQRRQIHEANIWPAIEQHLAPPRGHYALPALAVALAVYKLIEFVPDRDFGAWMQFVPLAIALAFFSFLRHNPFQINAGLRPEQEEQ
jgi:Putative zinc-finger